LLCLFFGWTQQAREAPDARNRGNEKLQVVIAARSVYLFEEINSVERVGVKRA
jgi:hypothetical protein